MNEPLTSAIVLNVNLGDWSAHGRLPLTVVDHGVFATTELTESQVRDLERQLHERLAERD